MSDTVTVNQNITNSSGISEVAPEKDRYKLPNWTGHPPRGSHLDVLKNNRLLQKVLVDEKGQYYFGRNPSDCDIMIEHASCSRVHALLLFHKLLKKFALVDLESCHGTFVNGVRIEPLKPVFLDYDGMFYFGASTRRYVMRQGLDGGSRSKSGGADSDEELTMGPETAKKQKELEDLTEYNTMQNRRVPHIPITLEEARRKNRQRGRVIFDEEEEIINPEDVDPTVGRFRNLVRTAVIPTTAGSTKRKQTLVDQSQLFDFYAPDTKRPAHHPKVNPAARGSQSSSLGVSSFTSNTLGVITLNAAADPELYAAPVNEKKSYSLNHPGGETIGQQLKRQFGPLPRPALLATPNLGETMAGDSFAVSLTVDEEGHTKKKYAKEAWPKDSRPTSVL